MEIKPVDSFAAPIGSGCVAGQVIIRSLAHGAVEIACTGNFTASQAAKEPDEPIFLHDLSAENAFV